jgi:hypothetical protein
VLEIELRVSYLLDKCLSECGRRKLLAEKARVLEVINKPWIPQEIEHLEATKMPLFPFPSNYPIIFIFSFSCFSF